VSVNVYSCFIRHNVSSRTLDTITELFITKSVRSGNFSEVFWVVMPCNVVVGY